MKHPKWIWIIHLGSSELSSGRKGYSASDYWNPAVKVFEITWTLTEATAISLGMHIENSPAEVSLPLNTCDAKPVMKLCANPRVWLRQRRIMLADIATCHQKNTPQLGNYERVSYRAGQTAFTTCSASAPNPWRRACVCCLQRLRQLWWWCCGSQMAPSHSMHGWVSNVGNWRWEMIE